MKNATADRRRFRALAVLAIGCAFAASAARADDTRVMKTEHYIIHTDLPKPFAKELAQRMETMYGEYEQRLPGFHRPADAAPLPAYLLTNRSDYIKMTHNPYSDGVFFSTDHPFLAAHLGDGRDELRKTLQHEAFHQFAHFAIANMVPAWANEGIAQVFEEGIWNGTSFWLGQIPPRRIRLLQSDIAAHRLVEFKKFLSMPYADWNAALGSKDDRATTNYNEAWAIAHFLMESGKLNYHEHLMAYLKDLHDGKDDGAALQRNFPNLTSLQADFSAWASTLQQTAGATMMEHQLVLGKFLAYAHEKGHHFKDIAGFRKFVVDHKLQGTIPEGRVTWKTAPDPTEYFCDMAGHVFGPEALLFSGGNEPGLARDIVCHVSGAEQFRMHFYKVSGVTSIEVLVQRPGE